uniref:WAP domain-containing protein n=1 Tax=Taeniopygia guttata TaxID=59729 RepID=A0A674GKV6_TAEGU
MGGGTFAIQTRNTAPNPYSQQGPGLSSAWSCPPVRFTCALHNPPNHCLTDRHCPRGKKCCRTFCGRKCLSNLKPGQ